MKYEGFFNTVDYSLTHNILLIRLSVVEEEELVNTDFRFLSTFYVEFPTYFRNLEIRQGTLEDCDYVLSRCDAEFIPDLKPEDVYILLTNGKRYFVGARKLDIEKNNLKPGETSIGLKRHPKNG